jgi:hypothetical protein
MVPSLIYVLCQGLIVLPFRFVFVFVFAFDFAFAFAFAFACFWVSLCFMSKGSKQRLWSYHLRQCQQNSWIQNKDKKMATLHHSKETVDLLFNFNLLNKLLEKARSEKKSHFDLS